MHDQELEDARDVVRGMRNSVGQYNGGSKMPSRIEKSVSLIEDERNSLFNGLQELQQSLSELSKRLGPVLAPSDLERGEEVSKDVAPSSPMLSALKVANYRVVESIQQVIDLTRRLEI